MFNSTGSKTRLPRVVTCCVILAVVLPSFSVSAAEAPGVSAHKSITQSGSTFRKASTVDLTRTKKVTKDDYGRILHTVSQPKSTKMIWLGQQSRTYRPPTPRTTWLGGKDRSD